MLNEGVRVDLFDERAWHHAPPHLNIVSNASRCKIAPQSDLPQTPPRKEENHHEIAGAASISCSMRRMKPLAVNRWAIAMAFRTAFAEDRP